MTQLYWLPEISNWRERYRALRATTEGGWDEAVALANARLDFIRTNSLDEVLRKQYGAAAPKGLGTKPIRLAMLGSCTMAHLQPGIRVGSLRRGIHTTIYENDYGQYYNELQDKESELHEFKPNAVLFSLDAWHLSAGVTTGMLQSDVDAALAEVKERIGECWRMAREAFRCPIIQQIPLQVMPVLLGENEHRLPGSRAAFIARLCAELRPMADADGVDLLSLDHWTARNGITAWHDPALWHRAKQEISLPAAPLYGDLVARLLAAKQGRSAKCLVLDLDNTVWGGVVGDDGLEGLVLGQGSALGEAFTAFQEFARELSRRGIILAVCSKNDEANAVEPFEKHPEMTLRRGDIACFIANWSDKASNIKAIAEQLAIGVDSLVFIDDNPFERALVRQELPMVAVPEVSDDPTTYPQTLADAGYFESLTITAEDRERSGQYQSNRAREALRTSTTDLPAYLRSLEMELVWRRFDQIGLQRTVQLINKTNQFNLTTRRYTDEDVLAVMNNPRAFGLQLRLTDRFGDNGIISIIIGRMINDEDLLIDTWLMSCRVLGRQVEPTTLNLVVDQARLLGAKRVIGEFVPTKKNAMVKDHYARLGLEVVEITDGGSSKAVLELDGFAAPETFILVKEG
jgi:FkbH-like protein